MRRIIPQGARPARRLFPGLGGRAIGAGSDKGVSAKQRPCDPAAERRAPSRVRFRRCRSTSRATSSRPATSRGPSRSSSRGSAAATGTRCCSASPARGRPSRSRTSSRRCSRPTLVIAHNKTLAAQLYGEFKELFPDGRGPLLRQLLRLLPAGGLRPLDGHVHREGLVDQRRDRPDAPRGDARAPHPERRAHRGLGLLHLRPRHRRGVLRPAAAGGARAGVPPRPLHPLASSTSSTSGTTSTSTAAPSACAATPSRSSRPTRRSAPSASSSSATWSRRSTSSIRSAATTLAELDKAAIFPNSHYVSAPETRERAIAGIREELRERLQELQRREQARRGAAARAAHHVRPRDARADGVLPGHRELLALALRPEGGRAAAAASSTTSRRTSSSSSTSRHQTVPQIGAMYRGDRSRKETLVEYGFRLPSRPRQPPAPVRGVRGAREPGASTSRRRRPSTSWRRRRAWWSSRSSGPPASSIRRSRSGRSGTQVDDLLGEIRKRAEAGERVLVTTLTKRMAEDLTEYFTDVGVRVPLPALRHRHPRAERAHPRPPPRASSTSSSASTSCARGSTSRRSRWWRSSTPTRRGSSARAVSLIQTIGRAARNVNGRVIMYADTITDSMRRALDETGRRREIQRALQRGARHHAADREAEHHATCGMAVVRGRLADGAPRGGGGGGVPARAAPRDRRRARGRR